MRSICEQYGIIDVITLKMKVEDGVHKSKGVAIVQYSTKEGAANALKHLPFETKLGDPLEVEIEFYKSLESRLNIQMVD